MTLVWLFLVSFISSVYSQDTRPFTFPWNINATSPYLDETFRVGSVFGEGLSLTWSNSQCTPTAVCIKRLLRPIPDQSLWKSHCSHYIDKLIPLPSIFPRIGYYHIMVYRSDPSCSGVLTLNGSVCEATRVFDGKKCESPITGHALRALTPGVPIAPFEIPPQLNLPDVGRKTFLFNNHLLGMKQGYLYVNASGLLTISGRYGAVTRLSPLIRDFQYNMTTPSYTLSEPFQGMRLGNGTTTDSSSYEYVEYMTFINYGQANVTVYNITTSIDQCAVPGQFGIDCVPHTGDTLDTSYPLTKEFLTQLPTGITSYAYLKMATSTGFSSVKLVIQNVPAPNGGSRILPDVYIRQGAIPSTTFNGDINNDQPDNHYDIFISAQGKQVIFYDFGQFETNHDWFIAFHNPSGAPLTPIVISVQQECAAECSNHGKCVDHQCQCDDKFTNYDCKSEKTPSDEIVLPSSWRYSLFMLALIAPIILFFVLKRHLNNIINRPSLASQGQGLGMGHPGHVLGGSDIQDSRRWQ